MKRSEFQRAVDAEFGDRGTSLVNDLQLSALGDRTSAQALAAGMPPREIWLALCDAMDVPDSRRLGRDCRPPRRP